MRIFFKTVITIILIAFVILQFFQPEKNMTNDVSNHIFEKEQIAENIKTILQNACLDCHSNQTSYLWYHRISPVSLLVNKHVIAGKNELNLSDWGEFDIFDKIALLEDICDEVESNKMPLKSYTAMHKEAKLTNEQIAELCEWTEKLGLKLLTQREK